MTAACGECLTEKPTAQAFDPDATETPLSTLVSVAPVGLGFLISFHFAPFQCAVIVRRPWAWPVG